ncbi:MAG: hypothetical protein L0H07_13815, partial [Corynebacterium sp.]|nr:hypothetical protein [Corynebacterium sp.]
GADETETPTADSSAPALSDDSGEGEGSSEGSLPGDISSSDAASSLADADWKAVASILSDVLGGDVSLQTILDIISVVNDGDATVGDVIGSVTGSLGGDAGDSDSDAGDADAAE